MADLRVTNVQSGLAVLGAGLVAGIILAIFESWIVPAIRRFRMKTENAAAA